MSDFRLQPWPETIAITTLLEFCSWLLKIGLEVNTLDFEVKSPDTIRQEILSAVRAFGVSSPMDLVEFFRLSDPGYAAQLEDLVNQLWPQGYSIFHSNHPFCIKI